MQEIVSVEEQRILDERIRKSQLECQKYKLENERAVIDNQRLKIIAHTTLFVAAVFVAGAVSVIVTLAEYGVIEVKRTYGQHSKCYQSTYKSGFASLCRVCWKSCFKSRGAA